MSEFQYPTQIFQSEEFTLNCTNKIPNVVTLKLNHIYGSVIKLASFTDEEYLDTFLKASSAHFNSLNSLFLVFTFLSFFSSSFSLLLLTND